MTVKDLQEKNIFKVWKEGGGPDREITKVFCCDLLSVAMGKGPEGAAWVTVMGNMNTIAVASLADMSCIILAEGAQMDEAGLAKAEQQGIALLSTEQPIFETALEIYHMMEEGAPKG